MTRSISAVPLRAARWSATHPWRAILLWCAFVAAAVALAVVVPTQQTQDDDYRVGQSGRAAAMVEAAGLEPADSETVLLTAHQGALDREEARAAAGAVRRAVVDLPGVAAASPPRWSADGTAAAVGIDLAPGADDVTALQAATARVQADFPDLVVRQAGDVSVGTAIDDRVAEDLGSAESTSLPVTLVLMLVAFGALIAAGIPVLLAVTSVAATIGLLAPLSHLVPAEPTATSMVVLIGMAVGVDYSLFYLRREREERRAGRSARDAVDIAARTSGHSVLVSGGAVAASLAGLYIVGGVTFDSLATAGIVVVVVAVLGSITVLPALLVTLGRWVDRPRVPLLWRLTARLGRRVGPGGVSARVLRPVVRHPVGALLIGGVVAVALAVPALGMRTAEADLSTLPTSIPQVQTLRDLTRAFPTEEGAHASVVVAAAASEQAAVRDALAEVATGARRSGLLTTTGAVQTSADHRTTVLDLGVPSDADVRGGRAVALLREELVPQALDGTGGDAAGGVPAARWAVGGEAAESLDAQAPLQQRLPIVVGFVLLLTLLVIGFSFRSAPVAVLSAVLNLVSVGVAFGAMTLVFQHGWFERWLDFTSPGFVVDWVPLFVLVVLVGLSMDYHVFVVSRIRELVDRGLPARLAVARGVADTAGVVTSAATVMVSVFALFATLSMLEMKTIGVGLCFAILFDATVVRLVLLPAALLLMGERAWGTRRGAVPAGERVLETEPAYQRV